MTCCNIYTRANFVDDGDQQMLKEKIITYITYLHLFNCNYRTK